MEERRSQLKVNLPKTNYLIDTLNYFLEEARSAYRININTIINYNRSYQNRPDDLFIDYRDLIDVSVLLINTYADDIKISTKLRIGFQEDLSLTVEELNNKIDSSMYKNILRMFLIPEEVPKYPDLEDVFITEKDEETTFEYLLKTLYNEKSRIRSAAS